MLSSTQVSSSPDATRFVPQPPVQFFYSLQKTSLRTVLDTLLSPHEIGTICMNFKVPCYGKWLKKRVAAEMLVDHLLGLKQAYQRDQFNSIVTKINDLKGKEMLGRIPLLPEKIDAINFLVKSVPLINKILKPTFPVRSDGPNREITGCIFLDISRNIYTLDLFFAIPNTLEPNSRFILCLYQGTEDFSPSLTPQPVTMVSPSLLDLTLNGSMLDHGSRFRNHDCYDITLLCYKDRANLLRILRHETHIDLNHLVIEIIAINIAGSFADRKILPVKRTCTSDLLDEMNFLALKDDAIISLLNKEVVLKNLQLQNQFDGVELVKNSLSLMLNCPISMTRIRRPVRFSTCKHGQCFDLTTWQALSKNILSLEINQPKKKNVAKVSCPVCGDLADSVKTTLVEDGLFKSFLDAAPTGGAFQVELSLSDGSFELLKIDNDYDEEDDYEDDILPKYCEEELNLTDSGTEIIDLESIEQPVYKNSHFTYQIDVSKPLGSCPSRAISID